MGELYSEEPTPEQIAAGVSVLLACVGNEPRIFDNSEIVRRIYAAMRTIRTPSRSPKDKRSSL